MAKSRYIGITIGPIFDTIHLTSSPAALWAASYIFSSLTKSICQILTTDYQVDQSQIVSPYYYKEDSLLTKNDGVGLFHDRIIFRAENFKLENMEQIRKSAIGSIMKEFFRCGRDVAVRNFLEEYIMISYAEFEAKNPIIGSAQMLDCMELSKPFVFCEQHNPFLNLFENTNTGGENADDPAQEGKNAAVKKLVAGFGKKFQLYKKTYKKRSDDGHEEDIMLLKSISDICNTGSGLKRDEYYAILRSDGDNMGKLIASLEDDAQIREFSKTCLEYCSEVAELVGNYGGVTIYSGGDDLLAILPLTRKEKLNNENAPKNLFEFVQCMNKIFAKKFKSPDAAGVEKTFRSGKAYMEQVPMSSLSFGIIIAYYKFPLYESLRESASLLFGNAKSVKNCMTIKLQKHTGQSAGLQIPHEYLVKWCELTQTVQQGAKQAEDKLDARDRILLSAMHKLALFETLFKNVTDQKKIETLFENIFDAEAHEDNDFVRKTLPEWFEILQNGKNEGEKRICALGNDDEKTDSHVFAMQSILRIQKFMIEKGGKKR